MNQTDIIFKTGGFVGGMLGSELIVQAVGDKIPIQNENKGDFLQMGLGAAGLATLGRMGGTIGSIGTYASLGALISGVLGLLKMKVPYLAQAGEEEEFYIEDEEGETYAMLGETTEAYIDPETGELIAQAGEELYIDDETGEIVAMPAGEIYDQPAAVSDSLVAINKPEPVLVI